MDSTLRFDRGWLIFWGVVSSIWCLTAAAQLTATFDEPYYLKCGLHAWRTGSYHPLLRAGTMPLPADVQLLPAWIIEQFRERPFNLDTDFGTVLTIARAGNLVFWWLLLYFVWRLAYRIGGVWSARLAVPFVACDPNFLAHAALATTDIAVSACLVMLAELYLAGRDQDWRRRVGIPAVCFALALLAKASALAFGFIILGVVECHRLWQTGTWRQPWSATRSFRREFVQIVGLGMLAVFLYCGCDWRIDRGLLGSAQKLTPGPFRDAAVWVVAHLPIFPNAAQGIVYQIQHNFRGHGAYVVGEWHHRAVWYYFPLVLSMKLTLPVLLLAAGTLLIRPRGYAHVLGLLVACLLLFTLNCRVQIGIRLILPVLSLALVCLAVAVMRSLPPARRTLALGGISAVLLVPMLSIWPHGLCYFNPLWGGPEDGYRHLSDSNYDWGQGVADLTEWHEQRPGTPLKIWYYGADPRVGARPGNMPLHNLDLADEHDLRQKVGPCYLAVGTTILHSNPAPTPSGRRMIELLKSKKPIDRTMTYFIYDFTEPTAVVATP